MEVFLLNLVSYYYFVEAAKDLHITNTAKRLFISQQNLSNHIQKLEQHYGVELFNRKPKLTLTFAGEKLLEAAERILNEDADVINQFAEISEKGVGVLRVGIPAYRAQVCLPLILPIFYQKWPNIKIQLTETQSANMEEMVAEGLLDVFVGIKNADDSALEITPLLNDHTYLMVSDSLLHKYYGNRAAALKQEALNGTDLKAFSELPYMLVKPPNRLRKTTDECFNAAGYKPNVFIESSNTELLISLYPKDFAAFFVTEMRLPLLEGIMKSSSCFPLMSGGDLILHRLVIAHRAEKYLTQYVKDFIKISIEILQEIEISRQKVRGKIVRDGSF
jgi:DNA-binding transcriptional LysR family regulator